MRANTMRKQLDELLSSLDQAERCGDAETTQEAYEGLFTFCQQNDLDLEAVIRQPRSHSGSSGIVAAVRALWPTS
ncbi:MAG TPA: hypothetical protein VG206_21905 [Terriglobia bacterium]|nr:hypothetical protein [Terriglobia bacterium]